MHVLITGASKGIGRATAVRFAAAMPDLRLSVCSRGEEELRMLGASLPSLTSGGRLLSHVCDVSDEGDVGKFVGAAEASLGPVDILINNAGFGIFRHVDELLTEEFNAVLATNLRGVFLMTQAVLPMMKQRKSGSIVTIASLAGKNGFVGGSAYCASKFGVRGLMQSLFLDVRDSNIRVITLFPGSVRSSFHDAIPNSALLAKNALNPEDIAEAVFAAVSLPPHATVSELDIRPTNPKRA